MSDQRPPDPYQPPSYQPPHVAAAEASADRRRRLGWFVTICVMAIALGGTGFLHSLYALTALTVGDPLDAMMPAAGGGPAELEELNQRFEQELADIEGRYFPALLPLALARLALTASLVIGGVGCLGGKPAARTLLIGTMAAALGFEICDTVVQSFVLAETAEPMRDLGSAMDPQVGQWVMSILHGGMLCIFYGCQLAKAVFYLGGLLYLRRASLNPLFQPLPEPAHS